MQNKQTSKPYAMARILAHIHITDIIPDKTFLKLSYRIKLKEKLDFNNPQTFNQKLQWLKIYDRQDKYTELVDKILVKDYAADKIGSKYVIPTLGIYDSFDDIDFDKLPDQFVLKCNHDSASVVICDDKKTFNTDAARKKLVSGLKTDMYKKQREWPYKNVKRKILAEKYIKPNNGKELEDYKLMVFNGKVKCSFVCSDRNSSSGLKVTFFDKNWQVMPFERHYPKSDKKIPKPENYEQMIKLAEILVKDIPFARVDFYNVNGKIYFGEITFFPGAGFEEFTPSSWDKKLGDWLELPKI